MNQFESYVCYVSIKSHFNQKTYDYFKYAGRTRITIESFENRPDKMWFASLSKKKDVEGFLVANFIEDRSFWIGNVNKKSSNDVYTEWKKRTQSLTYNFQQEIKKTFDRPDLLWYFQSIDHGVPIILQKFIRKEIGPETFACLMQIFKCKSMWKELASQNQLVEEKLIFASKYLPFLKPDLNKLFLIIKEHVNACRKFEKGISDIS